MLATQIKTYFKAHLNKRVRFQMREKGANDMKVSKMLKQAKRLGERQAKLTAKKTPNRVNKALIDVPS